MHKIADEAYEFKGTRFHLRAFEDSLGIEKPVFVFEETTRSQNALFTNRVEIAQELAGNFDRRPEDITWLELSPNGSLKQVDFQYTHTDAIYPHKADVTPADQQAAERGDVNTDTVRRYNTHEREVPRLDFQAQVGDALEPFEKRQNHDFERMKTSLDKAAYQQEKEAELQHNPLYDYAPGL